MCPGSKLTDIWMHYYRRQKKVNGRGTLLRNRDFEASQLRTKLQKLMVGMSSSIAGRRACWARFQTSCSVLGKGSYCIYPRLDLQSMYRNFHACSAQRSLRLACRTDVKRMEKRFVSIPERQRCRGHSLNILAACDTLRAPRVLRHPVIHHLQSSCGYVGPRSYQHSTTFGVAHIYRPQTFLLSDTIDYACTLVVRVLQLLYVKACRFYQELLLAILNAYPNAELLPI